MAKTLIFIGIIMTCVGLIWYFFGEKLSFIGNLPGDIKFEKENFKFYFPITTMLLVSLLINVLVRIFKYFS
ncbi:MAG: DUF2905 domain-containing protein [Saprospiraceae bacterium]